MLTPTKAPITVSDAAKARITELMAQRDKPAAGIKVGIRTRGCSGLSYTIEYADAIEKYDEVVEVQRDGKGDGNDGDPIKILIDPKAIMFLIGTEMDFKDEKLQSGFVFVNPNEKGRCGCGESFHV